MQAAAATAGMAAGIGSGGSASGGHGSGGHCSSGMAMGGSGHGQVVHGDTLGATSFITTPSEASRSHEALLALHEHSTLQSHGASPRHQHDDRDRHGRRRRSHGSHASTSISTSAAMQQLPKRRFFRRASSNDPQAPPTPTPSITSTPSVPSFSFMGRGTTGRLGNARSAASTARRWRATRRILVSWLLGLLLAAAIAVPAALLDANATALGITYVTWGLVLGIAVTLWPLARFVIFVLLQVLHSNLNRHYRHWRKLKMVNDARVQLSYALWAFVVLVMFRPVVLRKPLHATRYNSEAELWWILRLLAVNFVLGLLLVLRRFALTRLAMGKRIEGYVSDVHTSLLRQDILQWLTSDIPDNILETPLRELRQRRLRSKYFNETSTNEAARKLQSFFKRVTRYTQSAGRGADEDNTSVAENGDASLFPGHKTWPSTPSTTSNTAATASTVPQPSTTGKHRHATPATKLFAAALHASVREHEESHVNQPQHHPNGDNSAAETTHGGAAGTMDTNNAAGSLPPYSDSNAVAPIVWHEETSYATHEQDTDGEEEDGLTLELLERFEAVRGEPHRVCRGLKAMSSTPHARRLGHAVYDYYRGNGTAVPLARLMAPVRKHGTAQHVTVALSMLEADQGRTVLTEENLLEIFDHIYHTRKNLSLTLLNLESITSALAFFLSGALVIAAVLMLNIVFSTGDLAEVAITVSSAILGLSFIFSTSAQHMFDSFVFLFMRHAYDVGDRVRIDGIDPMDVEAIQLLHTTFKVWNGEILTIANYTLQSMTIFNMKRSGPSMQMLGFLIDMDTPTWKIDELEKRYKDYLRTKPTLFSADDSSVLYRDTGSANHLKIAFYTQHRTNFAKAENIVYQSQIIRSLKQAMEELGIGYYTATSRNFVRHWQGADVPHEQPAPPYPGEYVGGQGWLSQARQTTISNNSTVPAGTASAATAASTVPPPTLREGVFRI